MFEVIQEWAATRGVRLGLVLLVLAPACAKTTLTSIVNPPWRSTELRRVVVFFEADDPSVRLSFEENFGERARIASVDFIPSYTLSRGHPIAGAEFARMASENRVDALLAFTREEAGVSKPVTLPWPDNGCTAGTPAPLIDCGDVWSLERLWASYTVTLVDPANAVILWKAKAMSEEREIATWEDLRNSLTDKTIDQLLEDGVISR